MFEEICEGERVKMVCTDGRRIRLDLLYFGRYTNDTCAHASVTGDEVCPSPPNLFERMMELCSGRAECWYDGLISIWGDPCPGVHKQGHVQYTCQSEYTE